MNAGMKASPKPQMYKNICLLLALLFCGVASGSPPNILLVINDDESAFDLSAYGFTDLPTPGFDRIVKQGILFRNAYSSAPSCGPARAALLTGRHFWQNGQMSMIQGYLPKTIDILSECLRRHNYVIGFTGKGDGPASRPKVAHHLGELLGKNYSSHKMDSVPENVSPIDYSANFKTFLADREPGQPFFFWAGIIEPHIPLGKNNWKLLESEFGVLVDDLFLPPVIEDTVENRRKWGNYIYEVCYADSHLARMLEHLGELGELDNTLVISTADNGSVIYLDGSLRGKASPYDYGVRVPLAMMWPKQIKPGRVVEDFVSFADFAPTFLEIAGIEVPGSMTGRSLAAILSRPGSGMLEDRDTMLTGIEWHGEFDPDSRSGRAFRKRNYTYVAFYDNVDEQGAPLSNQQLIVPKREELYDLSKDPWQLNDLSADPDARAVLEEMRELFRETGKAMGDPRVTGEMDLLKALRQYVQERKRTGYRKTIRMPMGEPNLN